MITRMISRLEDENASVIYTISILLSSIARNENSAYLTRQMILESLSKAISTFSFIASSISFRKQD